MEKNYGKGIIKCVLLIFLLYQTVWIQRLLVHIFNIKKITNGTAVLLNTISNLIFLVFIVFVYRKDLKKEWKIFKDNKSENIDIAIKYWIIGLISMMVSNILISFIFKSGQANNEKIVNEMIKAVPIMMLINAGLIGPINEELLFRKGFRNIFKNKWLYVLVSGIIFGFFHVTSATSIGQFIYIIPYSCLGISFALAYYKTKSIYTSIFMHMTHNTILTTLSIISAMK